MDQPAGLIAVLTERQAEFGDRLDAAMDLGEFNEPEAYTALAGRVIDPEEDSEIARECALSLVDIWRRRGRGDDQLMTTMTPEARAIAEEALSRFAEDRT